MKANEISAKLQKRIENNLTTDVIIDLCFAGIKEHADIIEQSRIAIILSGIVQKGLGKKTWQFLKDNQELPKRVHEILRSAIMRMECF